MSHDVLSIWAEKAIAQLESTYTTEGRTVADMLVDIAANGNEMDSDDHLVACALECAGYALDFVAEVRQRPIATLQRWVQDQVLEANFQGLTAEKASELARELVQGILEWGEGRDMPGNPKLGKPCTVCETVVEIDPDPAPWTDSPVCSEECALVLVARSRQG